MDIHGFLCADVLFKCLGLVPRDTVINITHRIIKVPQNFLSLGPYTGNVGDEAILNTCKIFYLLVFCR